MDEVYTDPIKKESRAALMTGGAVRVGRAICLRLARDFEAVAVHCAGSAMQGEALAKTLEGAGTRARCFQMDLTLPGAGAELVKAVHGWSSRLDLLVNTAATFVPDDGDLLDLARMKVLNANAPAALVEAAAPLLEGTGGSVVNIADVAGFKGFKGFRAYSATKRSLLELTWRKALELAGRKVRVNAVCPGAVLFPAWYTEATRAEVLAGIPMGEAGTPEDIAEAVAYRAGARFVTGQALAVDGGRMLVLDRG